MIYKITLLTKDTDGGYTSETLASGDVADGVPDLTAFVRDMSEFMYDYDPMHPETDCLVRITVHAGVDFKPAEIVDELWFHDVKGGYRNDD